jgi:ATP synthase F1 complex assembly factor 2
VDLQTKHWDPLLHWARTTFEVEILTFNSILSHTQSDATKERFAEILAQFNQWEMAGADNRYLL